MKFMTQIIVSILILVDQSLELDGLTDEDGIMNSFNPYFSGSVTGTNLGLMLIQHLLVSILILVDQSLELSRVFSIRRYLQCFNPYFSGSVTGTIMSS